MYMCAVWMSWHRRWRGRYGRIGWPMWLPIDIVHSASASQLHFATTTTTKKRLSGWDRIGKQWGQGHVPRPFSRIWYRDAHKTHMAFRTYHRVGDVWRLCNGIKLKQVNNPFEFASDDFILFAICWWEGNEKRGQDAACCDDVIVTKWIVEKEIVLKFRFSFFGFVEMKHPNNLRGLN